LAERATGRVPDACGYSFETSPKPSASSDSPGYQPAKSVFDPSLAPLGLPRSTPSLSTAWSSTRPCTWALRLRRQGLSGAARMLSTGLSW